ncbi:MAG TPA: AMP-binding protein, partial [Actinomycetes bacterium]
SAPAPGPAGGPFPGRRPGSPAPRGTSPCGSTAATAVRQAQAVMDFRADDVVLAVAPLFHTMGLNLVLAGGLHAGATVVTMPRFDLEGFLDTIQRHRVTTMIVAPPIMLALAGHPVVDRYDLSSLRVIGCGAAPLSGEVEQRCADRLGCVVLQGLGMTETTCTIAISPPEAPRRGSVGRLLAGTEARIVDPETGADFGPGRTGELWVRGPQLMRGYHDQPEATARTIDPDGWLHTGDLCAFDEDGYLYVVDRLKELIKYKGAQVAPAELEHLLLAHPAVADAAVVPRPDAEAGEVPVAYVVPRGRATADELLAWVAERVAPYKRLRVVEFTDQVPRSMTGKLLRRVLVEAERARYVPATAGVQLG